jgi:hypothetical protein
LLQERSTLHTTATRECECEKDNKGSGNCRIDQRQSHVTVSAIIDGQLTMLPANTAFLGAQDTTHW